MGPEVSIVVLTWNALEYSRACLDSLRAHTPIGQGARVIVVDNGSTDGTLPFLRGLDWITLVENGQNLGYARGSNAGIRAAPFDHDIVLLNNDVLIPAAGWIGELQRAAYSASDIGIVGCRLVMPDGRLLHAGVHTPPQSLRGEQIGSLEKDVNQYSADREVPSVVGACMYIRREVLDRLGMLDEDYFSYYEDTDYCLRAADAGFRTVCAGAVTLVHHENVSIRENRMDFSRIYEASRRTFRKKWGARLKRGERHALLWQSEVGSTSGYAVSSRELLLQLDELGVNVRLAYIYGTDWMDVDRDDHRLAAMRQRPKYLRLPQVVYAPAELFSKNSGRYRVGYTMLEVDGIPSEWVEMCNGMDEVWVPTTFNAATFRASGVTSPLHVMPLGVNPDYFNTRITGYRASARFTFLSVFEWGERKAPDLLLDAYSRAFSRADDVLLVLKVSNLDPGVDVHAQVASAGLPADGPPVVLLHNQDLPAHQMGSLYRSADCFVLATRGEGWGMPILEAMACGLPVIATGWGGQMDFYSEQNGYPVDFALVPARAKCPYYRGFRWAEPNVDHLAARMRCAYENPDEARAIGARASEDALERWTWRRAALRIRDRVHLIHEGLD